MSTQFTTPVVTEMQVIPVAGHDSMLMNLSGAHAPFFTRNIVIIKDNSGHTGVGEIPGGEKIRKTLEDAIPLVVGKRWVNIKCPDRRSQPVCRSRCGRTRFTNIRSPYHYPCGDGY